jgi:ferredoxin
LLGYDPGPVRIAVDLTLCQGYAQCCFLAPDTFRLNGNEALMYVPEPAPDQEEAVLRSAAACPVQAILVDREPPDD